MKKNNKIKKLSGAKLKAFKEAFESSEFGFKFEKLRCNTHVDRGWYYYTINGIAECTYNDYAITIYFKSFVDYCSKTDQLLSYDCTLFCAVDDVVHRFGDVKLRQDVARFVNHTCINNDPNF